MCHPRVVISRDMIGSLSDMHTNGWIGAFQLYEQLGSFIFKCINYGERAHEGNMSAFRVHDMLRTSVQENDNSLEKFISVVRARTLLDVVTRHEDLFVQKWCFVDHEGYQPWTDLEDWCVMREDLDLFYVGSVRCKFPFLDISSSLYPDVNRFNVYDMSGSSCADSPIHNKYAAQEIVEESKEGMKLSRSALGGCISAVETLCQSQWTFWERKDEHRSGPSTSVQTRDVEGARTLLAVHADVPSEPMDTTAREEGPQAIVKEVEALDHAQPGDIVTGDINPQIQPSHIVESAVVGEVPLDEPTANTMESERIVPSAVDNIVELDRKELTVLEGMDDKSVREGVAREVSTDEALSEQHIVDDMQKKCVVDSSKGDVAIAQADVSHHIVDDTSE